MSARSFRLPLGIFYAYFDGEMEPTFKNLLDFIQVNKTDKVFKGYSEEEIVQMLKDGIEKQSLYFEQGFDGRIVGCILAEVDHTRKLVFVTENLSMSLVTLKRFAAKLKLQHPGYDIAGKRHGTDRYFDTKKLYTKLI